ncbi:hypothetical protein KCM76_23270 [Zooshikella marina]|uniref:hypothetical protein n=1 Tax=Zooshikella ganghwensis TaxID=202772 RepID=UPI001BAEEB63|nr:hypothetical protein [Zooshikella ganghwensis]MBU2708935.1 hypothetical protein [Zooshikella ganghwensis]
MNTIQALCEKVESELTDSNLTKATDEEIYKNLRDFPGLPEEYLALLKEIGYGSYGQMGFSIYGGPIDPDEIFDSETAKELEGYVLVGDDYSGWMIGYQRTENGYFFKEFYHHEVMDLEPTNIIDFLTEELFRE